MEIERNTTTTTTTSLKDIFMNIDSTQYELLNNNNKNEFIYSYFLKMKPWCLGQTYDYCPLMIIIMIFVILISILLIIILCIHNRKPFITRLLINYIIKKKNDFLNALFCKKNANNNNNFNNNNGEPYRQSQHSAIHNSIWWTNDSSNFTNTIQRPAPPPYEESTTCANAAKSIYLTSILAPVATIAGTTSSNASSSGYGSGSSRGNTATINNAFSIENIAGVVASEQSQQPRDFRENGIDTVEIPVTNYYDNRRVNRNNLSFMSTDSFHYINTSNSSMPTIASSNVVMRREQPSSISLQLVPLQQQQQQQSTSTLRSELMNELPPDYDTVINAFKKVNDIDNLNKFKKLQQKYQQSASQSRRLYYQQRQQSSKHQQQQHRQSTATILSEVEVIV